ncbi:MAG: AraC family transcriptional regulator [Oscillospiraceae bacterium]|nr:AraC family transcriptional regulator [Oscillospiraceae bacterium]
MIYDIFSGVENPDFSFPFNIVKGTLNGECPEHQHDSIEMTFVIDGKATHIIGENIKKIGRGEVIIILSPASHRRINMQDYTRYTLRFDLEKLILLNDEIKRFPGFHSIFFIEPVYFQEKNYSNGFTLNEDQLEYSINMLDIMYDAFNLRYTGYKTIIKTHLAALMTYISHCYNPVLEPVSNKLYKISETVSYIEKNYSKKITVKELSAIACLSERQYNRVFTGIYGISPNVYLMKTRLNKSCRFLEEQDLTIHYISTVCGFFDDAYFIKQFKRYFNMTPGEYRKNLVK